MSDLKPVSQETSSETSTLREQTTPGTPLLIGWLMMSVEKGMESLFSLQEIANNLANTLKSKNSFREVGIYTMLDAPQNSITIAIFSEPKTTPEKNGAT